MAELCSEIERLKKLGNNRLSRGDSSGALQFYLEGIAIVDGNAQFEATVAEPLQATGALSSLCADGDGKSSVSALSSLGAALHANSAQVMLKKRRWLEAIDHCNAALRHDPA